MKIHKHIFLLSAIEKDSLFYRTIASLNELKISIVSYPEIEIEIALVSPDTSILKVVSEIFPCNYVQDNRDGVYVAFNLGLALIEETYLRNKNTKKCKSRTYSFLNSGDEILASSFIYICKRCLVNVPALAVWRGPVYSVASNRTSIDYGSQLAPPHPSTIYSIECSQYKFFIPSRINADLILYLDLAQIANIGEYDLPWYIFYQDGISSSNKGLILSIKDTIGFIRGGKYPFLNGIRLILQLIKLWVRHVRNLWLIKKTFVNFLL